MDDDEDYDMIEYKAHYMKIVEDDSYNLDFTIFIPDEGYTYQYENDKPKTLDDAPGSWIPILDLGNKGWKLNHVITKNLLLIGIFNKDTMIQEVNILEEIRHTHKMDMPKITEFFDVKPRIKEKIRVAVVNQDKTHGRIVESSKLLPDPEPPQPKPPRIIYEADGGPFCNICSSSFKKRFFKKTSKCIQPKCSNYWDQQ